MKLWLLRPIEPAKAWEPWYDKAFGFVIRANLEQTARKLANSEAGDENRDGVDVWLDKSKTICVELYPDGNEEIIIRDFAAA